MNKKGIIAIVAIIILVIIGFSTMGGDKTTVENVATTEPKNDSVPAGVTKDTYAPVTKDSTDATLLVRLKSASVSAAETGNRVALTNGTAKFTEGSVKGTITLGDVAVEKEIGGVKYVLASLSVNSGGAQILQYVVLFEDRNGTLTDKSYALIGDRTKISGIRADAVSDASGKPQLVVSVSYSEGSTARTKILVVENGIFNAAKEISL